MRPGNRIFDDVSSAITGAAGLANGVKREIEQIVRGRLQAVLANMDLVQRDEYEALEAHCVSLSQRLDVLEAQLKTSYETAPTQTRKASGKDNKGKPRGKPKAKAQTKSAQSKDKNKT